MMIATLLSISLLALLLLKRRWQMVEQHVPVRVDGRRRQRTDYDDWMR